MTLKTRFALVLLLATTLPALAQDGGYWKAASKNASAITGDISVSEDKLGINYYVFTIAQIRTLQATEINSVFNAEASGPAGNLYRLNIPAKKMFMRKNTLCGAEDTQWMATYVAGKTLQVAFFSGPKMPVFTPDALAGTTDLCGTFTYSR
jgi:hypothetical protein